MAENVQGIGNIEASGAKNSEALKKRRELLEGGMAQMGQWFNGFNVSQLGNMLNGQIKDTSASASMG